MTSQFVYDNACWCQYCLCCGTGFADWCLDPWFGAKGKCCCLSGGAWLVDPREHPYCGGADTFLCCTRYFECVPKPENPKCICCTKSLVGGDSNVEKDIGYNDFMLKFNIKDQATYWLYFCYCVGLAVHLPGTEGRPWCFANLKCCCIQELVKCDTTVKTADEPLCEVVRTCLCCWEQCQFPPDMENGPILACCSVALNKNEKNKSQNMTAKMIGKPAQQQMD